MIPERLLLEFEKLSKATDFMTGEQAKKVIDLINQIVRDRIDPHIIDILWKREALEGVILDTIDPAPCFDKSSRRGVKPFHIQRLPGAAGRKEGVWAWLWENRQPVWVERTRSQNLDKPLKNLAGGEIDPEYLYFHETTDSLMAVPLITRNVLWGIYSVELPDSGRFNEEFLSFMKQLAAYIARILWKVEALRHNQKHTDDAIVLFCDSILPLPKEWDLLSDERTGFIARPFTEPFDQVNACITSSLEAEGVEADHYRHPPGGSYVLDQIIKSIHRAHFCIIDITGQNCNVLIELGVTVSLGKEFILLKSVDDPSDVPFNINNFHQYRYELRPGPALFVASSPGAGQLQPIDAVLRPWIRGLEQRHADFRNAKRWKPPETNGGRS